MRKRFEIIQKKEEANIIIRATGDNPLIDIELVKYLINYIKRQPNIHYVQVNKKYVSPGFCVEIYKNFFLNI